MLQHRPIGTKQWLIQELASKGWLVGTRYITMMLKLVNGGGWIAMPDNLLWYLQTG